jgi:ferrous iron transport protein A
MESMERAIVPLAMLPQGVKGRVVNIGSYGRGLARRMSDMGLYDGLEVRVVSSCGAGPVLLQVKDCTVAVGRGVANQILVAKEM